MKDKVTAGLPAFLFGGFGLHLSYLGQTRLGIIYIVFCWTLIGFLIGIIDAFWFGSQRAFNAKYNADAFPSIVQMRPVYLYRIFSKCRRASSDALMPRILPVLTNPLFYLK